MSTSETKQAQSETKQAQSETSTKIEIFDTTLRDGSQLEGISLTVDDKLRIAEQLDYLGVDYIEGGWPGANPKDEEFFRRAATELHLDDVDVGGVRVDPPRQGQGRRRRDVAQSRRGRHIDGVHRRQGVGLPRDRSAAHRSRRRRGDGRRFDRVPEEQRPTRVLRRRALLRRLSPQSRVLVASARGSRASRCRLPRAVRHQRRVAAVRRRAHRRRRSSTTSRRRWVCTCTTTPIAASPTRWPACAPARRTCRAPSTATANASATAISCRSSPTSR